MGGEGRGVFAFPFPTGNGNDLSSVVGEERPGGEKCKRARKLAESSGAASQAGRKGPGVGTKEIGRAHI